MLLGENLPHNTLIMLAIFERGPNLGYDLFSHQRDGVLKVAITP